MDRDKVSFEAVIFLTTFLTVWVIIRLFTDIAISQILVISIGLSVLNMVSRLVVEIVMKRKST